jgi:hypothetical protein
MAFNLRLLPGIFAVCHLAPDAAIPSWAKHGALTSVTRTTDELSIVCPESQVPEGIQAERGWRCIKIQGPLPFSLIGVLASLAVPLAEAKISIFAFSTFETDYIMVKAISLEAAISALARTGYAVERDR